MPILEAIAVTVLVYYTAAKFLVPRNPNNAVRRLWITPPFYREVPTSSNLGSSSDGATTRGSLCTFAILAGVMAAVCGVLAVPTAYFARIVYFEGKGYCEIDLSPLVAAADTSGGSSALQTAVSVYYLAYSAVLSYWLPLFVSAYNILKWVKLLRHLQMPSKPQSSRGSKRRILTPPLQHSGPGRGKSRAV